MKQPLSQRILTKLWDLWCISSVIGIWPRFIEPAIISTTKLNLEINDFPKELEGLKILQFSDLHFSNHSSKRFISKLKKKIASLNPDLILFTGDMICYAQMKKELELESFLSSLKAPLGKFCILGNHDYASYVSKNRQGDYDILHGGTHFLIKAFEKYFFHPKKKIPKINAKLNEIPSHPGLKALFKRTNFHLLENDCIQIEQNGTKLNILGLGDYWLGKCDPKTAFQTYDDQFPGIILSHNPDTIHLLNNFPGQVILSGHTHGGQVNLPIIWKHFIGVNHLNYKRGLHKKYNKYLYINRGIGAHHPFRWFSTPELLLLTLSRAP